MPPGDVAVRHASLEKVIAHAQRFSHRVGKHESRFAEHECEHDFTRSFDARSGVGKATCLTTTSRFGHRVWSQIGSRLARPRPLVSVRVPAAQIPMYENLRGRNVARSSAVGYPSGA